MHPNDPGWFDDIYRRYGQTIYSHSLSRVGDEESAADLTQEAFVPVYRERHLFGDGQSVEASLLRAADRWCDWAKAKAGGKDL